MANFKKFLVFLGLLFVVLLQHTLADDFIVKITSKNIVKGPMVNSIRFLTIKDSQNKIVFNRRLYSQQGYYYDDKISILAVFYRSYQNDNNLSFCEIYKYNKNKSGFMLEDMLTFDVDLGLPAGGTRVDPVCYQKDLCDRIGGYIINEYKKILVNNCTLHIKDYDKLGHYYSKEKKLLLILRPSNNFVFEEEIKLCPYMIDLCYLNGNQAYTILRIQTEQKYHSTNQKNWVGFYNTIGKRIIDSLKIVTFDNFINSKSNEPDDQLIIKFCRATKNNKKIVKKMYAYVEGAHFSQEKLDKEINTIIDLFQNKNPTIVIKLKREDHDKYFVYFEKINKSIKMTKFSLPGCSSNLVNVELNAEK